MNPQKLSTLLIVTSAALLVISGCQDPYAPAIQTPAVIHRQIAGYSVENRPIELFTIGTGHEKVLIKAAIHGNEPAGIPLAYRLMEVLRTRPDLHQTHTIQIIPLVNPDGYRRNTRHNISGVDLNRNFPAANSLTPDALSEPESRLLYDLLTSEHYDRIVSIHQPLYCIDYDGPARSLAEFMAQYCPLPVKKLGGRPGSLGSFCEEHNIPIITMELAASDSDLTSDQLWALYGKAILAAITYPHSP